MKLLLLLLVLAFPQQQVDPCLTLPPASPPPATACPPPGMMNWNCVYACDFTFSKAVARANKTHCYKTAAILADYMVARDVCNADYDTCIYNLHPPSECVAARDACTYAAGQAATAALNAADAARDAAIATATATHAGCTAGCCEQQ